jgi:hypothetical protein
MSPITLERKRARGEGCVGRVRQGGSKGLRSEGIGEGQSSQTESIPRENSERCVVSWVPREGAWAFVERANPGAVLVALFERGRRERPCHRERKGTADLCSWGMQVRAGAGRSSSLPHGTVVSRALGKGAEGNGKEAWSRGEPGKGGKARETGLRNGHRAYRKRRLAIPGGVRLREGRCGE